MPRWPERTAEERYAEKFAVGSADECWPWMAASNKGYGVLRIREGDRWTMEEAHRFGWSLHFGPIPHGLFVCHTCDNRGCQNPNHWFLGACAENLADMRRKGRDVKPPGSGKLIRAQVEEIRRRYAKGGESQTSLASEFGITQPTVSALVLGKTWRS